MLNRQRQENDSPWQHHGITKEVRKYDYENPFYVLKTVQIQKKVFHLIMNYFPNNHVISDTSLSYGLIAVMLVFGTTVIHYV